MVETLRLKPSAEGGWKHRKSSIGSFRDALEKTSGVMVDTVYEQSHLKRKEWRFTPFLAMRPGIALIRKGIHFIIDRADQLRRLCSGTCDEYLKENNQIRFCGVWFDSFDDGISP